MIIMTVILPFYKPVRARETALSSLPTLEVSCLRADGTPLNAARPRSDVYPKTHGACAWRSELRHDDPWGTVNGRWMMS